MNRSPPRQHYDSRALAPRSERDDYGRDRDRDRDRDRERERERERDRPRDSHYDSYSGGGGRGGPRYDDRGGRDPSRDRDYEPRRDLYSRGSGGGDRYREPEPYTPQSAIPSRNPLPLANPLSSAPTATSIVQAGLNLQALLGNSLPAQAQPAPLLPQVAGPALGYFAPPLLPGPAPQQMHSQYAPPHQSIPQQYFPPPQQGFNQPQVRLTLR